MLNRLSLFLVSLLFTFGGGSVMAATIQMTIDHQTYSITLHDNDAANDFVKRLPMTLTFENFGQFERIAYLKAPLNLGQSPTSTTPKLGDITYYIPWGNIAVFINSYRASDDLVPLGSLSAQALEAIKQSGNKPIHFSAHQ